jgi:Helicase associated domain
MLLSRALVSLCFTRPPKARRDLNAWYQHLRELWAYKQEHGDCLVPKGAGTLAYWVRHQRACIRAQGRKLASNRRGFHLSEEQVDALHGFGLESDAAHKQCEKIWSRRYNELQAFHAAHGHCRVTKRYNVS